MVVKAFLKRASLALVPHLYMGITGLLFPTYREEVAGGEHYQRLRASGQPYIICFWHYSLLYVMRRITGGGWVAMVSASDDAEYVSRTLNCMGHDTVRGSRNSGGLGALKELITRVRREGKKAAIVADGSQGPPLQLQPGVILLASRCGIPILPLTWGADRCWTFRSWDRTALAKPFARLSLCFGEPFAVPEGLKAEELEPYRLELEQRMLALYHQSWGPFIKGEERS